MAAKPARRTIRQYLALLMWMGLESAACGVGNLRMQRPQLSAGAKNTSTASSSSMS